jgi:hypothetical protein
VRRIKYFVNGAIEMLILEELAREYTRKKYGKELPEDFHGIDYIWIEKALEMAEKSLNLNGGKQSESGL